MRPAGSAPWLVHAQNTLPYPPNAQPPQGVFMVNPPCDQCGASGEVTQLPYTVPPGKILTIDAMHLEALWGAALIVMIGHYVPNPYGGIPGKSMPTFSAGTSPNIGNWNSLLPSVQWTGLGWEFGALSEINVRLSATIPGPGIVYGWDVSGWLCDA